MVSTKGNASRQTASHIASSASDAVEQSAEASINVAGIDASIISVAQSLQDENAPSRRVDPGVQRLIDRLVTGLVEICLDDPYFRKRLPRLSLAVYDGIY